MRRQGFSAKARRASPTSLHSEPLDPRLPLAFSDYGGASLTNVHVQNIYLGSDWADASKQALAAEKARLEQFSTYIVKSSYMSMLYDNCGQKVGYGTSEPGCVVPLNLDKTKVLDDSAIRLMLLGQISAAGSKVNGSPDSNTLYMIYLEPGLATKLWTYDSRTNVYGWHGALAGKTRAGDPVDVRYAVIAHPGSPNLSAASWPCSTDIDLMTLTASHELAEAATDPDVNYKNLGWYDKVLNGEVGDIPPRATLTLGGFCVQSMVDRYDSVVYPSGYQKYVYHPPIALPKTPSIPKPPARPPARPAARPAAGAAASVAAATDVSVRVRYGRLMITGAAAGSRFLQIVQDADDPALLDVIPLDGTTVNGTAAMWKIPFAGIPQGMTVTLNSGSGANTATTLWIDTGTAAVSGNVSVAVSGDGNSVVTASGAIGGRFAVSTGGGDDQLEISSLRVGAATVLDTGTGTDSVSIRSGDMRSTSIVERGGHNSLTIDQATMSNLTIDERGAVSSVMIDGLTVSGGVSARQAAGRQLFNVHDTSVVGVLEVRQGSTPDASTLMFVDDTLGGLVVRCGNGGYAIQTNALDVRGDVAIALGNGNSDVGLFETVRVGGTTSIAVGAGNSAIGIVGFPGETTTPKASVFGRIGIVMGKGDTAVALNNLSATALAVRIATASAFVGIGGPITVPVLRGDLYGFSGNTFSGGPAKITGAVSVSRTLARR